MGIRRRFEFRTLLIISLFVIALLFLAAPELLKAFGPFPGVVDISLGQVDASWIGATYRNGTGYSLACGDFNGDGVEDMLTGSRAGGGAGKEEVYRVHIPFYQGVTEHSAFSFQLSASGQETSACFAKDANALLILSTNFWERTLC